MAGYCTEWGFTYIGQPIMKPALIGLTMPNYPGPQNGLVWQQNYFTQCPIFLQNMWDGWNGVATTLGGVNQGAKCEFWPNRVQWWSDQIANSPNLSNPQTNSDLYQLGRKEAKITFAQTMFTECECSGPVPQPMIKPNNENITPKSVVRNERSNRNERPNRNTSRY